MRIRSRKKRNDYHAPAEGLDMDDFWPVLLLIFVIVGLVVFAHVARHFSQEIAWDQERARLKKEQEEQDVAGEED